MSSDRRPTKSITVAARLEPAVKVMLDEMAQADRRSLSGQIAWLIIEEFRRRKPDASPPGNAEN